MPTITNAIVIAPDSNRATGNVFGQKQTWYKEMEKARQLLTSSKQNDMTSEFTTVNANEHDASLRADDNADGSPSSGKADNSTGSLSEAQTSYASSLEMLPGIVNARPVPANLLSSSVDTGMMFRIISTSKASTQPVITQQNLSELERILRSEIQPQNLQFINTPDGIKIYFRDYRMDNSEARKVIEKIRKLLAELNIEISDIVVNGNIIEQKRAVNQEAT